VVLGSVGLCIALSAGGASAAEYTMRGLPEFGRCVKVRHHKGMFAGKRCLTRRPGGTGGYEWLPGAGASQANVTVGFAKTELQSIGKTRITIVCPVGNANGEIISEKAFKITKLVFLNCKNPAVAGEKTWCQTPEVAHQITGSELYGVLGIIQKVKKKTVAGLDLHVGEIHFECEGYNETLNKTTGLGVKWTLLGSVIGRISPINEATTKFIVPVNTVSGQQHPESFEGGEKDTLLLAMQGGSTENTLGTSEYEVNTEQSIEIKATCKGEGC
jgi:hypothetical protein